MKLLDLTANPVGGPLRTLWHVLHVGPDAVIAPVRGGGAALAVSRPLVTILDGRPENAGSNLRALLERIQARRSALVYAADRPTAVAYALAWSLDLSRIRLANPALISPALIERELARRRDGRRSWHST